MTPDPNPIARLKESGGLLKQRSWSPDSEREEVWLRRKGLHRDRRLLRSRSVTDDDLDELRACIDLGFSFDAPAAAAAAGGEDKRLAETFPALDLYFAVRRSCSAARSPPLDSSSASADESPTGSPLEIFSPGEGDTPEMLKARLKQWAQVVAWSVRQGS